MTVDQRKLRHRGAFCRPSLGFGDHADTAPRPAQQYFGEKSFKEIRETIGGKFLDIAEMMP
jgi:hypothetical protein